MRSRIAVMSLSELQSPAGLKAPTNPHMSAPFECGAQI